MHTRMRTCTQGRGGTGSRGGQQQQQQQWCEGQQQAHHHHGSAFDRGGVVVLIITAEGGCGGVVGRLELAAAGAARLGALAGRVGAHGAFRCFGDWIEGEGMMGDRPC